MNPTHEGNTNPLLPTRLALWQKHGKPRPVTITAAHDKRESGEVYVQTWDAPARTKRAVKWFAILWALAAFSAIFPLVHFVLVPGLLIAGPIAAFLMLQQESVVLGGHGKCPACGASLEIVRGNYFKPSDRWPLNDTCANCREDVLVEKAGGESQT
jgi:hypothetical protein